MTYFSTHRSVPSSVHIRETASCNRWKLTETYNWAIGNESLWSTQSSMGCHHPIPLLKATDLCEKGDGKAEGVDNSKEVSFRYEDSQRLCSTHKACTGSTQLALSTKKEKWTWVPTSNQEAFWNWYPLAKKNFIFSNGVSLVIYRADIMLRNVWPTQNKRHAIFVNFFFIHVILAFFVIMSFAC